MKRAFAFGVASLILAACLGENIKSLSKAQLDDYDKKNWGGKGFEDNAKGAGDEVAAEMMAIKDALAREMLFMKSVIYKSKNNPAASTEPEYWLKEAQATLSKPLYNSKRLPTKKLGATPNEAQTLKGLESAYNAIDYIEKNVRPKMLKMINTEIEGRIFYRYNKFQRAKEALGDRKMNISLNYVDIRWDRFNKLIESIEKGTDKFKKSPSDLMPGSPREQFFKEILADTGLDKAFTTKCTMEPKFDRNMRILDRFMKTTNKENLDAFENAVKKTGDANNELNTLFEETTDWYNKNALSITPYLREYVARLLGGYSSMKKDNVAFLNECLDIIDMMKDSSSPYGELRACNNFSPNKAFFLKDGAPTNGEPNYTERAKAIAEDIRRKFEKAAYKIYERNNAPYLL